jgi:hypothetical protein
MADRGPSSFTHQDAAAAAGAVAEACPRGVEVAARDAATARLIEELRQRHVRLLMQAAMRRGAGDLPSGESTTADTTAMALKLGEAKASPVDGVADQSTRGKVPAGIEVVAPIRVEASNVGTALNREPAILVDYKEAAHLLSLCKAKPSDTAPDQAERRGVDALKQRVASGKIPPRCIKRSGRRVQFVRIALIEWACGKGRVQT